jgi:hypothetical protein
MPEGEKKPVINVDKFMQEHQDEIARLVNASLNRAGDIIQRKVAAGEIQPNLHDVLPVLLYETLLTNTVATLRLVARMLDNNRGPGELPRKEH